MDILKIIVVCIFSYLLGSIPWALVIGKTFYKTDIRNYGSKNLGGTNAGRVLGKKAGIAVIILDGGKGFLVTALTAYFLSDIEIAPILAGLFACIGHCFPIFANFKGGKAVATAMGYILALGWFVVHDSILIFWAPLLIFFICLALTKYVSLSSMLMVLSSTIISYLAFDNKLVSLSILILFLFITYRHKANIIRIIKGTEKKITWIK